MGAIDGGGHACVAMTDNSYAGKTCNRLRSIQKVIIPETERGESYAQRDDKGGPITYAMLVATVEKIKEQIF